MYKNKPTCFEHEPPDPGARISRRSPVHAAPTCIVRAGESSAENVYASRCYSVHSRYAVYIFVTFICVCIGAGGAANRERARVGNGRQSRRFHWRPCLPGYQYIIFFDVYDTVATDDGVQFHGSFGASVFFFMKYTHASIGRGIILRSQYGWNRGSPLVYRKI